jgi:hypothetical protein
LAPAGLAHLPLRRRGDTAGTTRYVTTRIGVTWTSVLAGNAVVVVDGWNCGKAQD